MKLLKLFRFLLLLLLLCCHSWYMKLWNLFHAHNLPQLSSVWLVLVCVIFIFISFVNYAFHNKSRCNQPEKTEKSQHILQNDPNKSRNIKSVTNMFGVTIFFAVSSPLAFSKLLFLFLKYVYIRYLFIASCMLNINKRKRRTKWNKKVSEKSRKKCTTK